MSVRAPYPWNRGGWPYHDNWDYVTTPTIIFEPTSEAIATVHGYRIVGGVVQSVDLKVSSLDDSTQGTYVIIKEAEFNYTIYPDFKNGVYTKNGITWLRPTNVVGQDGTLSYEDQTTVGDTIYEASAYKFKCLTGQHDSWFFGGGSEFAVTIARLLPSGTTDTHTYTFDLTRKEIKNQTEKVFNNSLYVHTNWQPSCDYVHYRYFERDGGGSENQYTVNFTYQGATVSATIKTKSSDDYFGSDNLYR